MRPESRSPAADSPATMTRITPRGLGTTKEELALPGREFTISTPPGTGPAGRKNGFFISLQKYTVISCGVIASAVAPPCTATRINNKTNRKPAEQAAFKDRISGG